YRRGSRQDAARRRRGPARRGAHRAAEGGARTAARMDGAGSEGDGLMGRTNEGWKVGRWLLLSILTALHLSAQVGHEPTHSPYHDIRRGGVGVITVGYLGGSRGGPGVGISDGPTGGLRHGAAC